MSAKTLLIVDDEPELRSTLQELFENEGWSVMTAENGRKALDKIESHKPSVVLSDIKMPDMDGLELLERVYDGGSDTPVILLTGFRDAQKMQRAWESCVFDFNDKPFDAHRLIDLVDSARVHGREYVRSARARFSRIRLSRIQRAAG